MIYNLPLSMILQKLTDIDSKLALLVDNQSIDMLEEMEMEMEKEEKKSGRKSKRGANK